GRCGVAQRVPVLTRRNDLRGHGGGAAQHHCAAAPAARERRMIDAGERAAMEETVRGAIADALATAGEGTDVDAVLAQLGWLEMLHDQPDDAIGIVFGALGATNATASALDDVLAWALGREPRADLAVLLPPFATWDAPGRIDGSDIHATGLAT